MKKFLLGLMALLTANAFAQSTHTIDFEPTGVGADWTWTVSDNDDNPALEFISNPVSGTINTSATVVKFIARQAGNNWALCHTADDGEFTFDASNSIVKIMVYKTVLSDVGFKVEGSAGANKEIKVANTKTNEWEELTFDFSSEEGKTYKKLVIIPDFVEPYVNGKDRTAENIIYFDNIQVPNGVAAAPDAVPATAASAPTHDQANVTAIFSDTYTTPTNANYNPGWGQSTEASVVDIDGRSTLKYKELTYQGTTFDALDISAKDYLHLDYWTADGTEIRVSIITPKLDDSGGNTETAYLFTPTQNAWASVDIPLSHFTSANTNLDLTSHHELKIDTEGTPATYTGGLFYFDNIYYYSGTPTAIVGAEKEKLTIYPNPVTDVLNIAGLEDGTVVEIYGATGSLVKKVQVSGGAVNVAELAQGVYFVSVNGATSKIIKK